MQRLAVKIEPHPDDPEYVMCYVPALVDLKDLPSFNPMFINREKNMEFILNVDEETCFLSSDGYDLAKDAAEKYLKGDIL